MTSKKQKNKEEIRRRVDNGDLLQYFSLDDSEIQDLTIAVRNNTFEEIAFVLQRNITSGGEGIEPLINDSYDSEIEDLARKIIEEHINSLEIRAIKSFKENDVVEIRNLISQIENIGEIFPERKNQILEQLKVAERKISIPESLEEKAIMLVKSKGKNPKDIKNVVIVNVWGRWGRKALVVYDKKGIMTWAYFKKAPRVKKLQLKYVPTKEEFKEKKITQLKSRKGTDFTIKERLFIQSRKKKTIDEIYKDYVKTFGKVRPKSEIQIMKKQEQ